MEPVIQIRIPKWLTKIKENMKKYHVLKKRMMGTVGFSWSLNISKFLVWLATPWTCPNLLSLLVARCWGGGGGGGGRPNKEIWLPWFRRVRGWAACPLPRPLRWREFAPAHSPSPKIWSFLIQDPGSFRVRRKEGRRAIKKKNQKINPTFHVHESWRLDIFRGRPRKNTVFSIFRCHQFKMASYHQFKKKAFQVKKICIFQL